MAVDVNCTLNELETAVRAAPAHRSYSGIIVNARVFETKYRQSVERKVQNS